MHELTEVSKAYIAGIIDGEGHVGITKGHYSQGRPDFVYSPVVDVANTNKALITYLAETTGLAKVKRSKPSTPRARESFYWRIYSQEARALLEMVLPYLQIKREQALIVIQHAKEKRRGGGPKLTVEVRNDQLARYTAIRKLNQRGNIPTP